MHEQLKTMSAQELRTIIDEAKQLLKRKKLYIREIGKPSGDGHHVYLYATWQEDGKTRQKSLGRKQDGEAGNQAAPVQSDSPVDFSQYGISDATSVDFLLSMIDEGYFIAN
ncbi:MAG: hypothetical protein KDE53_18245 [Caldilineaceae bacterium]|nr:hypothetical protein [Caldilineaceae bacterium]MCB0126093.1 hypothetical protein [Caldilineaceae bacterium]